LFLWLAQTHGQRIIHSIRMSFFGTSGSSTASNPEIFATGDGLFVNVPTGDSIIYTTQAVNMFQMGNLSSATFGQSATAIHTLKRIDSTPNDTDVVGSLEFTGPDSGGADTIYAHIDGISQDVTNTTEDGRLTFNLIVNAVDTEVMRFESGGNWLYKTAGGDADLQMFSNQSTTGTFATIRFEEDNSSGTQTEMARITLSAGSVTAGSEAGNMRFQQETPSGGLNNAFEMEGTGNGLAKIAWHNHALASQQTVTGARDETEGALANLLTALANYGLIVDSTTAS